MGNFIPKHDAPDNSWFNLLNYSTTHVSLRFRIVRTVLLRLQGRILTSTFVLDSVAELRPFTLIVSLPLGL